MPRNAERGQHEDAGEPDAAIEQHSGTRFTHPPWRESRNIKHARKVISHRARQEHEEKLPDLSNANQRSKRYIYFEDGQPTAPTPAGDDTGEQTQEYPEENRHTGGVANAI